MKKISLQMRLTLFSGALLTAACILLTLASNFSAQRMAGVIEAAVVVPSINAETTMMTAIEPAAAKRGFKTETIAAMVLVVAVGTLLTYYISGKALEPVRLLNLEIQKKSVDNLGSQIALPSSHDELYALTSSFNELSERLSAAFALQRRFSADVAHELRTPLAVLQAKFDVFDLAQTRDASEYSELIASSAQQVERLKHLVEDLLEFSTDAPIAKREKVLLAPLFADISEVLAPLTGEKSITISLPTGDDFVWGDDGLLERVFYNLLENAVKYSPHGAHVDISVQRKGNDITICVADNGDGIHDALKESIFEPFFRGDRSKSRKAQGNGLGLAICRAIVQKHGGKISVRDNLPNGCVFQIILPA